METDKILPLSRVTAADVESKVQLAVSRVTGAVESIALVQYLIVSYGLSLVCTCTYVCMYICKPTYNTNGIHDSYY